MPMRVERAMYQEMITVQNASMRDTPVLTGAARASHVTDTPIRLGDDIKCSIYVGGPSLEYVVPLHEKVEWKHRVGHAKFLENALMQWRAKGMESLAKRLKI